MKTTADFWDKIAARYAKNPVADEAAYQKKLNVTRKYFRPDMQVLEIGCGTGSTAIAHAPFVQHIRATDISPRMIEISKTKTEEAQIKNVSFEVASLDELVVGEQSLDSVLALSVLHLLEDLDEAVASVHKMLKPNGIFVTNTACLGDTMKVFKVIAPIGQFFGLMPLLKVFTVNELSKSLTDGGFDIDYQWQPAKSKAVFIVAKKIA